MIDIRLSRPEETPAQQRLWKAVFGDDDAYIRLFYDCLGGELQVPVVVEDGVLVSMLALLPMALSLPGGGTASAQYVYALATDPAARGKGYGRQLLRWTDRFLSGQGVDCLTIVPAEPSLFKFFATVDFAASFSTRKVELLQNMVAAPEAGDLAEPASPEAYNAIRDRLLAGTPSVRYPEKLIRLQLGLGALSGGGLYRVVAGGAEGCAAAEYVDEDSVLFKELLLPPEAMARGLAALAALLPGRRCHVRTPAGWEGLKGSYLQPFGMLKWYNAEKEALWGQGTHGYLGLAFD